METMVLVLSAVGVQKEREQMTEDVLIENGYLIANKLKRMITSDQARVMLGPDASVGEYTCAPVVAYSLRRENAYGAFDPVKQELEHIYASDDPYTSLRDHATMFPTSPALERTLLLIKPGYSAEMVQAVQESLDSAGFVVVGKASRTLETEAAEQVFMNLKQDVEYNTSDVSIAMVLERMDAVDQLKLMLGPADPTRAKVVAPQSLRARFGEDSVKNALYGSESVFKARRDMEALFPTPFDLEHTLALVKPGAMGQLNAIMDVIKDYGFTVLASDTVNMSAQAAIEFFGPKCPEETLDDLAAHMSSGGSTVLALAKPGAIDTWKKLLGPEDPEEAKKTAPNSLRARFGTTLVQNGLHGSSSKVEAVQELARFFPQLVAERDASMGDVKDFMMRADDTDASSSLQGVLLEGLTQLCRVKPRGMEAVTWLADWLLRNNPNKPRVEEPAEEQEAVSVAQQISDRNGGARLSVVWCVGGPGSGKNEVVSKLAGESKYEYLSAAEILRAARASKSEAGRVIDDHIKKGRIVPTHVTTKLLQQAMQRAGGTRFMIDDYPYSLDQAFAFEETVAKVDGLLLFECAEATMLERLRGDGDVLDPSLSNRLKAFSEDIAPLTEHYRVFNKLYVVNSNGAASDTIVSAKRAMEGIKRHARV